MTKERIVPCAANRGCPFPDRPATAWGRSGGRPQRRQVQRQLQAARFLGQLAHPFANLFGALGQTKFAARPVPGPEPDWVLGTKLRTKPRDASSIKTHRFGHGARCLTLSTTPSESNVSSRAEVRWVCMSGQGRLHADAKPPICCCDGLGQLAGQCSPQETQLLPRAMPLFRAKAGFGQVAAAIPSPDQDGRTV